MSTSWLLVIGAFLINLPFGYLRSRSKRYSLRWFLAIHLPVLAIIAVRISTGVGMAFIPLFIMATVLGQLFGSRLRVN